MGTLYISGIVESVERNVRYWINKVGRPNHVMPTLFEREIHPDPWPVVWLGRDLGTLFIERIRKLYRDSSDQRERAAFIGLIPQEGRVPAIVEMTSRAIFGESMQSLTSAEIRELDEHDKTLLARAKAKIVDVITAPDEDEPEEEEQR
jgi:hypothetical protein